MISKISLIPQYYQRDLTIKRLLMTGLRGWNFNVKWGSSKGLNTYLLESGSIGSALRLSFLWTRGIDARFWKVWKTSFHEIFSQMLNSFFAIAQSSVRTTALSVIHCRLIRISMKAMEFQSWWYSMVGRCAQSRLSEQRMTTGAGAIKLVQRKHFWMRDMLSSLHQLQQSETTLMEESTPTG